MTATRTPAPRIDPPPTAATDSTRSDPTRWLALLRIAAGSTFLWAFLDKTFGLGYATPSERSWLNGGSPTSGFLGGVNVGPFESMFTSWSGSTVLDWLFMMGLLGVGVAVVLGVAMRPAAVAGTLMLGMMWLAQWPLAKVASDGELTRSNNPLIDSHVIDALVLIVLAATAAGRVWGLGRRWEQLPIVRRYAWLR